MFNICMVESDNRKYDSFSTNVPMLSERLCVHMRKKAVAFETSCVYSAVYVFLRRPKTTAYQSITTA